MSKADTGVRLLRACCAPAKRAHSKRRVGAGKAPAAQAGGLPPALGGCGGVRLLVRLLPLCRGYGGAGALAFSGVGA
jgi:hypothetical protein